jgi:hypothetical protein
LKKDLCFLVKWPPDQVVWEQTYADLNEKYRDSLAIINYMARTIHDLKKHVCFAFRRQAFGITKFINTNNHTECFNKILKHFYDMKGGYSMSQMFSTLIEVSDDFRKNYISKQMPQRDVSYAIYIIMNCIITSSNYLLFT